MSQRAAGVVHMVYGQAVAALAARSRAGHIQPTQMATRAGALPQILAEARAIEERRKAEAALAKRAAAAAAAAAAGNATARTASPAQMGRLGVPGGITPGRPPSPAPATEARPLPGEIEQVSPPGVSSLFDADVRPYKPVGAPCAGVHGMWVSPLQPTQGHRLLSRPMWGCRQGMPPDACVYLSIHCRSPASSCVARIPMWVGGAAAAGKCLSTACLLGAAAWECGLVCGCGQVIGACR
jgi:hypothetical protein